MGVIGFKTAKCKDCYKCVRICDVKAIKIKDEHVQFMANECVECGQCLAACPQNSIVFFRRIQKIKDMIAAGEKTVVSLAPAYLGTFNAAEPAQMATALRMLGFTYIHETAEAAPYLVDAYITQSNCSSTNDVVLTTSCSAINNLIEKYHPDMIPYMVPVVTPAIAHARMLRAMYGPDVKIIYISPCVADGGDALVDARTRGVIDEVLDFATLRDWLRGLGILIPQCERSYMDSIDPKVMRLFAVSGGVLSSIKAEKKHRCKHNRLYVSGISSCEELFTCIRNGEIKNCVIELNSCIGGCINGPMTGGKKSDRFRSKINVSMKVDEHDMPDYPALPEGVSIHKTFEDRSKNWKMPTEEEIRGILQMINKDLPEQELNCGACGFPTCRAKAVAVYQKKSDMGMCMPFMYEQARSTSNVLLSVIPNMIIVADRHLNVKVFNMASQQAFGKTAEEAIGRPLAEIIPVDLVQRAFAEKQDLRDERVDYPQYGLKTMQNILYIKDQKRVLILMRDITEAVRRQEQLVQVKLDTVAMAQNVINKQMMVAQEIAGLLGETTAETKSTLRKLRDTLMAGDEEL